GGPPPARRLAARPRAPARRRPRRDRPGGQRRRARGDRRPGAPGHGTGRAGGRVQRRGRARPRRFDGGVMARPTLEAVAERAGVSRATASRVVNGGGSVREALRERVNRAVQELGYVPNRAARSLVTRRHDAVAVVVAESEDRVFSDPFFAQQLRGISAELTAADVQVVLLMARSGDFSKIARYLAGGYVDGAVVFSLHQGDALPSIAQDLGLPTVYGGRPDWAEGDEVLYVDSDNRGGAR